MADQLQTEAERESLLAQLSPSELQVYGVLLRNHFITSKTLAGALQAKQDSVERTLAKFRSQGLVECVQQGKQQLWRPSPTQPAGELEPPAGEDGA